MNLTRSLVKVGTVAIKAGSSALAKLTNAALIIVSGRFLTVAAADLPALTGFNVPANTWGLCFFAVNASGTVTPYFAVNAGSFSSVSGNPGYSLNLAVPVQVPADQVILGGLYVGAGATAFTGGTTALDAGTYTFGFFDGMGQVQPVGHV